MIACQQSGQDVDANWLPEVRKSISGKGKIEEAADFRMTRYACYLTAQNADAYAESIPEGFRITAMGREFVKEYFSGG